MGAMPPTLAQAAGIYHTKESETARAVANTVQTIWRAMQGANFTEKREWFETVGAPAIAQAVRNGEAVNVARTLEYMSVSSAIQDIDEGLQINPAAFVHTQEEVEAVVNTPMSYYVGNTIQGVPEQAAFRSASLWLTMAASSAVQDAGRDAASAVILGTDGYVGYYRQLSTPSCKRCAVLAGKFFEDNEGFERHPRCDCTHVPAGEAYDDATTDPVQAIADGKVTGLSKADTEAILEHNADVSQVINASQGLTTETLFGQKVKATTVGTSSRAVAGKRLGDLQKRGGRYRQTSNTRLSVGQIMKFAKDDPEMAKSLLYRHGYAL